jgi:DNA invertase Pin-like site-specific DNA recombinase
MNDKFIAYFRVSTNYQGLNGLGMSAQKATVENYVRGCKGELVGQFAEVESGKAKERPELDKAIALCRKTKSKLLIARLDRLARNASFTLALRDSGVDFIACDMPEADRFTIGLFALLAEKERDDISSRTKAALAAAKRRGVKLGNPKIAAIQPKAIAAKQEHARAFAAKLKPVIEKAQRHGVTTLQELADALNARGYKTPNGKAFFPQSVKNLLALLEG